MRSCKMPGGDVTAVLLTTFLERPETLDRAPAAVMGFASGTRFMVAIYYFLIEKQMLKHTLQY